MPEINVCNSSGRDAVIAAASVATRREIRWVDEQRRQATSERLIKSTVSHDLDALVAASDGELANVSQALSAEDPEIDLNNAGRLLRDTGRVYVSKDRQIMHNVRFWEIVRNADGVVRERRVRKLAGTNGQGTAGTECFDVARCRSKIESTINSAARRHILPRFHRRSRFRRQVLSRAALF